MRNVGTQDKEKYFFPFLFQFQTKITQSQPVITRFTGRPNVVQDGECLNPV